MLDIPSLFIQNHIVPKGVIHIGAHEGQELTLYEAMGFEQILFIEANPEVFARLCGIIGDRPGVGFVQCAVTDYDGKATLHTMSMDQSSSLLEPKEHLKLYPMIEKTGEIQVDCRTLDSLMDECAINPANFNYLHMDIQGAELKALKGASKLLPHLEAITCEINFVEMYKGCPMASDIDAYLGDRHIHRVAQIGCEQWGDGFYVKKPAISARCIGNLGRFGNSLFQYVFARTFAEKHGRMLQTGNWIGRELFPACGKDDRIIGNHPMAAYDGHNPDEWPLLSCPASDLPPCLDLSGFFQFHTSYYAPYRDSIREWLQPIEFVRQRCRAAWNKLTNHGVKPVIAIHLRKGDYTGGPLFYQAPLQWYHEWLKKALEATPNAAVYVASDDPLASLDFLQYGAKSMADIMPKQQIAPEFYLDFYVLSMAHRMAISNSSFSVFAAMLNKDCVEFARPSVNDGGMISFEPWNTPVLLGR